MRACVPACAQNRSTAMRGLLGAFMSRESLSRPAGGPASTCTRTILDYGLPLERDLGPSRPEHTWRHSEKSWVRTYMINSRDALFDFFDVGESVFGWSRWRGVCETDQLTVRMFTSRWRTREGLDLIANDVIYVAFSTTFVYLYLALHFRSLLLATLGMHHHVGHATH